MPLEPQGTTPSERYLAYLARRSFLSLWSYSNLFTDEGRKSGKGDGKELADLLVVFDRHILIFSDKHCEFPAHADLSVSWKRWYKRAIEKSVRQVLGARSWLLRYPSRIYLDKSCQEPFPFPLPAAHEAKVHLIAVTRGAYGPCRDYFAGQSTGSLVLNSAIRGSEHYDHPFMVGHVLPNGPYVHVLDELTLNVLLRELDTISDLVEYLERKEALLSHPIRSVVASGEEQLIAMYLTQLDATGHHNFVGIPDDVDGVYVDEGHWEEFIQNPQYRAKKEADAQSYAWDRLIEHFAKFGEVGLDEERNRQVATLEPALRVLASETRLARRQLATQLMDALQKSVPAGQRFLRLGYSTSNSQTAYVFLVIPPPPFIKTYDDYREGRRAVLLACCKVAKLRATAAHRIVGIATEPGGTRGASEDLVLLEVHGDAWGPAQEEEARRLQVDADILLDERVEYYERRDHEYPEVRRASLAGSPADRLLQRARLRRLEAKRRSGRRP